MHTRIVNALIALALTVVFEVILLIAYGQTSVDSGWRRVWVMLGAELPAGLIQTFTFFLFFLGLLDVRATWAQARREAQARQAGLLPEREQYVLSPDQVAELKIKVLNNQEYQGFLLTDLIVKACTKYRANQSTSEALEVVTTQSRINLANAESEQTLIRYILWAIPSVGFVGTVLGIAGSLKFAGEISSGGLEKVTQTLNVAFDTTLVALLLSIVLMFYFNLLQEKVEKLHTTLESYVIENLINRIYKR